MSLSMTAPGSMYKALDGSVERHAQYGCSFPILFPALFQAHSLCSFTLRPDLIFKLRLSAVDPGDIKAPWPHPLPVAGNITSRIRDYPTHPPKHNNHLHPVTGGKKNYICIYINTLMYVCLWHKAIALGLHGLGDKWHRSSK